MSIDTLFSQYDDPNIILNDPAFIEFDRLLKLEEYRLLFLLRKLREISTSQENADPLNPIILSEIQDVNVMVMSMADAKGILGSHLGI